MGDHRLESGDNPDYIHGENDDCRVCADARAKAQVSPHETWVTPEEQAAREAASLSSYTDIPIPEIQDAIDKLEEGDNVYPSITTDSATGTGLVPTISTWDEVGLGIPNETRDDVRPEAELPTVEYGGPVVDAPTHIDYASLADNNPGPTPQVPNDLYHQSSEFSEDEEPVVSGSDEYTESDDADGAAAGDEGTEYVPFGLSTTAVLTETEVREQVASRIRQVEVERVNKELALWEANVVGNPAAEAANEVVRYRVLHENYLNTFSAAFGGE